MARGALVEDYGLGGHQIHVTSGEARFLSDLEREAGGLDLGPTPHDLACAALAACTAHTLRLYADRKGFALRAMTVDVRYHREEGAAKPEVFVRAIDLPSDVDGDVADRLMAIANRCPVHRLLEPGAEIRTHRATPA